METPLSSIHSKKIEIYFARHGQTEFNLTRRVQGQLDSPLTELGVNQVRKNQLINLGKQTRKEA